MRTKTKTKRTNPAMQALKISKKLTIFLLSAIMVLSSFAVAQGLDAGLVDEGAETQALNTEWTDDVMHVQVTDHSTDSEVIHYYFDWDEEFYAEIERASSETVHYYFDWDEDFYAERERVASKAASYYFGWDYYTREYIDIALFDEQLDLFLNYYLDNDLGNLDDYGAVLAESDFEPTIIPILLLSTSSMSATHLASTGTVHITSNRTWTVSSNSPGWLLVGNFNPSNRTGSGSFVIVTTTNSGTTSRTGTITVTTPGVPARTVTVTQAAAPATLTLSTQHWGPSASQSQATVRVDSNRTWNVSSSNTSWLTVSNFSPPNRTGNGSFNINATQNTSTSQRTGTITVTAPGAPTRTITVSQMPAAATLTLQTGHWGPSASHSQATVRVDSNTTWTPSSNSTSWLTVGNFSPTNRTGNGSFTITATQNTSTSQRTGTITVTSVGGPTRTISVSQMPAAATLEISTWHWGPSASQSQAFIRVDSNTTWTPSSNSTSWLTVSNFSPPNRTGNGSFNINATQNTSTVQRTGTITITSVGGPTRTITVSQMPAAATLEIPIHRWDPTASASTATVLVGSNTTWTPSSNSTSWLTVDNFIPANRTGNGSFRINVTANTGISQRTGTITVTSVGGPTRTVSVTQAAQITVTFNAGSHPLRGPNGNPVNQVPVQVPPGTTLATMQLLGLVPQPWGNNILQGWSLSEQPSSNNEVLGVYLDGGYAKDVQLFGGKFDGDFSGESFGELFYEEDGIGIQPFNLFNVNTPINVSTPLFAWWQPNTGVITVQYNSVGHTAGNPPSPQFFTTPNGFIDLPGQGSLRRDGYIFGGWRDTNNIVWPEGRRIQYSTAVSGTRVFYAHWVADVRMVTITFEPNGTTIFGRQALDIPIGVPVGTSAPVAFNIPFNIRQGEGGYIPGHGNPYQVLYPRFIGWSTNATGGSLVAREQTFTQSATLYARWTDPSRHLGRWWPLTTLQLNLTGVTNDPWYNHIRAGMDNWGVANNPISVVSSSFTANRVVIQEEVPFIGFAFLGEVVNQRFTGTSLTGFDIYLYRQPIENVASGPNIGRHVESIMSHEIGHVLGLEDGEADRNPTILGGTSNASLMNQNRNRLSIFAPTPFDNQSVRWLYE